MQRQQWVQAIQLQDRVSWSLTLTKRKGEREREEERVKNVIFTKQNTKNKETDRRVASLN